MVGLWDGVCCGPEGTFMHCEGNTLTWLYIRPSIIAQRSALLCALRITFSVELSPINALSLTFLSSVLVHSSLPK